MCVCVNDGKETFLLCLLCLSCWRRRKNIDNKGCASCICICISISVNMYICVHVCTSVYVLMTEREHFCCICVGVVRLDSGRHRPSVFSFARNLLSGTLSLKIAGKNILAEINEKQHKRFCF